MHSKVQDKVSLVHYSELTGLHSLCFLITLLSQHLKQERGLLNESELLADVLPFSLVNIDTTSYQDYLKFDMIKFKRYKYCHCLFIDHSG